MGSRSNRNRRQSRSEVARRAQQQAAARPPDPVAFIQQQVMRGWQGPIPAPEDLAHYQRIDPALPDRIMAMAEKTLALTEKQTDHRIGVEKLLYRGMNFRAHAGLWVAAVIALSIIGSAVWLISSGHEAGGSVIGGLDIASMAGVFIYGRYDQARQEQRRTEQ